MVDLHPLILPETDRVIVSEIAVKDFILTITKQYYKFKKKDKEIR